MPYEHNLDPFRDKQPPIEFMEELNSPIHKALPAHWNEREKTEEEVFIQRAKVEAEFPDEEDVLATAYEDFEEFLRLAEMVWDAGDCLRLTGVERENGRKPYVFRTVRDAQMKQEAYRILAGEEECVIASADTEGIRRALFYIEDEMHRREGNFLPRKEIYRYAVVKDRISRGFLNPHYKPGCDGELQDDTEYEVLVNGEVIWKKKKNCVSQY